MPDFTGLRLPSRRSPRLTTKEGWRAFCANRGHLALPAVLTRAEHDPLDAHARRRYDHQRLHYQANFGPLETPDLAHVHAELRRIVMVNAHDEGSGARPGAVIDGYPGVGKTTILTEFGRSYERYLRDPLNDACDPGELGGDDWVPVVFVTLPPAGRIKDFDRALLRFYGFPFRADATADRMAGLVEEVATRCRTSLVLVDEFHNLADSYLEHRLLNTHLKHLANVLPATFVYAGVDCEASGLLDEGRAEQQAFLSQTSGRMQHIALTPFPIGTPDERRAWRSLIASVEDHLVLLDGTDRLAERHWDYLHHRTDGYVGSLVTLLLRAAATVIIDRDGDPDRREHLGLEQLEQVTIDLHAERRRARATAQRRRRRARPRSRRTAA